MRNPKFSLAQSKQRLIQDLVLVITEALPGYAQLTKWVGWAWDVLCGSGFGQSLIAHVKLEPVMGMHFWIQLRLDMPKPCPTRAMNTYSPDPFLLASGLVVVLSWQVLGSWQVQVRDFYPIQVWGGLRFWRFQPTLLCFELIYIFANEITYKNKIFLQYLTLRVIWGGFSSHLLSPFMGWVGYKIRQVDMGLPSTYEPTV